jgi:hypothetical protein
MTSFGLPRELALPGGVVSRCAISPGITLPRRVREPATGESGGPESGHDMAAATQQFPHQSRTVVLDHHDDRPLVEAAVPGGDPPLRGPAGIGEGGIDVALKP